MVNSSGQDARIRDRKGRATKGKREATKASNLGSHKAKRSIIRGCKGRTIGKREHQGCVQANTLSGNKVKLGSRSLGTLRQGIAVRRSGDL